MTEDPRLYAIARKVTDEVLGKGTYDKINHPYKTGMADKGDAMRVNDPGPVPGQAQTITELYAWTVVSPEHGTEGIVALEEPFPLPLVGTNRATVMKFRPFAREVATKIGTPVRLRRFVQAFDEHGGKIGDVIDVVLPEPQS